MKNQISTNFTRITSNEIINTRDSYYDPSKISRTIAISYIEKNIKTRS